jgi:hypothetical protein
MPDDSYSDGAVGSIMTASPLELSGWRHGVDWDGNAAGDYLRATSLLLVQRINALGQPPEPHGCD